MSTGLQVVYSESKKTPGDWHADQNIARARCITTADYDETTPTSYTIPTAWTGRARAPAPNGDSSVTPDFSRFYVQA